MYKGHIYNVPDETLKLVQYSSGDSYNTVSKRYNKEDYKKVGMSEYRIDMSEMECTAMGLNTIIIGKTCYVLNSNITADWVRVKIEDVPPKYQDLTIKGEYLKKV